MRRRVRRVDRAYAFRRVPVTIARMARLMTSMVLLTTATLPILGAVAVCSSELDCTLSGECIAGRCVCDKPWSGERCSQLKLKPARLAAPFVWKQRNWPGKNHFTWGAAPFPTKDGRSCFYFTWLTGWDDGNHTKPVPTSDKISGSLGIACASTISGPYSVVTPIAFPFRPGHFDASYNENPVITYSPHDNGYLMAYTTSPASVSRSTKNWEGNGGLQYIGFAMSKDPMSAQWQRLNRTILYPKPDGFEKNIAINAAVLTYP